MRCWVAAAIFLAGCPTWAQAPASNRCAAISNQLGTPAPFSRPRLFIRYDQNWQEVTSSFIGADLTLPNYSGGKIRFIYAVPPSDNHSRQFLSIRTVADANEPENFVNLRRQHSQFDTVYGGTYDGYHANGETSAMLRRFHKWASGDRSDEPLSAREAWLFQTKMEQSRRRVLSIPYLASEHLVCVPFVIGPNIATPIDETEGEDEITILKGFVVEITEAKTASGSSGRTFKIRSPVTRVP